MRRKTDNSGNDPSDRSGRLNSRVLIVEDEKVAREATQRFLEFCGYEVFAAKDPETAVALADEVQPHVVICDCNLRHKTDGIQVARSIQQKSKAAVIFVSAYSNASQFDEVQDISISGWLRKPISLKELESVVDKVAKDTAPTTKK